MNLALLAPLKSLFLLCVFSFFSFTAFSQQRQDDYEPKILILSPARIVVQPSLEKEYKTITDSITSRAALMKAGIAAARQQMEGKPKNIQLMMSSTHVYLANYSFSKQVSYFAESYLSYRFF
jgi:hypothetical protein